MDSNLKNLCAMAKDQQNIFLIQELERILTEIICPVDYIMDVFISDIMHDDCVIEKYTYRKRKNFLLIYRGLLFLMERRFEMENLSKEIVLCFIRTGMVLTITEIWNVFVQERD